jgi:hypothetical protein
LKDSAVSKARALETLRGEVNNRSLLALTARLIPDLGPFRRNSVHDFADADEFQRVHELKRSNADLQNAIAQATYITRAQLLDTATLGQLAARAAATEGEAALWQLGVISDIARTRKGDDAMVLRGRVAEALEARPLPPEQAEVATMLDAVLADAKAIGELYRQLADPNADLSALTDSEFASRFAEKAAEGSQNAAVEYALERRRERRTQQDQANADAASEIRRATSKPVRQIGTKPAEAGPAPTPTTPDEPAPDSSPAPAPGSAA